MFFVDWKLEVVGCYFVGLVIKERMRVFTPGCGAEGEEE
jgi:hypothetical protein